MEENVYVWPLWHHQVHEEKLCIHFRTTSGPSSRLVQPLTVWFIDYHLQLLSHSLACHPDTHITLKVCRCVSVQPTERTTPRVSHKSMYISICWTNIDKCAASGTVRFQAELCEKWLLEDTRLVRNYQTVTPTGPHSERGGWKNINQEIQKQAHSEKRGTTSLRRSNGSWGAGADVQGVSAVLSLIRFATLVKAWVQIHVSKFSCGHKVQSHPSAHRCSSGWNWLNVSNNESGCEAEHRWGFTVETLWFSTHGEKT